MKKTINFDVCSYLLLALSCIILAALFYYQPMNSDDWYMIWTISNTNNVFDNCVSVYKNWTGRLPVMVLSSFVFSHPFYELAYRIFIIVEVFFMIGLAWYCAVGKNGFNFINGAVQSFVLFGMFIWLALPARSETVVWLSGNSAYLVPVIFGLFYMACSNFFLEAKTSIGPMVSILTFPFLFLMGFLAGSSQEQIIAACAVYSLINLYQRFQLKNIKSISINYWILLMGFSVGALFLIAAPGNYVRLSVMDAPGLIDIAKRMTLYISSAFFEIGTGELGKPIWMGILLLFALFYDKQLDTPDNVREAKMWLCVSFATLLTLIPATNQISPRTTFFAVIFLYIAVATFLFKDKVFPKRAIVSLALLVTSALVLVEATVGLIANISVASEFNHRWALINANQSKQMTVPFISTVPSNLTYIQTPEQDREFLKALSAHFGFKVEHDTSEGAPLPASLKPLKAIKFQ